MAEPSIIAVGQDVEGRRVVQEGLAPPHGPFADDQHRQLPGANVAISGGRSATTEGVKS